EIRHEDLGARVERVDHHLALDRPRDLRAPVQQIRRRRSDREALRRRHEPRPQTPPRRPRRQQPLPLRIQFAMQPVDERDRRRREDVDLVYANCCSSVDPRSASVDESLATACTTRSKYPAPTSRWCLVAVNAFASPRSGVDVSNHSTSAYGAYASERAIAAPSPSRTRKKPSLVRSPVTNSASRSSTSLVRSVALSASVRATSTVGTFRTSAARRAAASVRMNCEVGTSTLQFIRTQIGRAHV